MSFVLQETAECRNLQSIHLKSSGWQIHSAFALSHMGVERDTERAPAVPHIGGLMRATILGVIGLICVATAAQGQTTGLNHVWTVSGVMQTAGGLAAFIPWTNTGTASTNMAVDVYGAAGAFITGSSITVAPNATVIFGTSSAGGISVDVNLGTGTLTKGSARVLASTTKGVVCSAFLADALSAIPSGMTLTIAKKTKQKGD